MLTTLAVSAFLVVVLKFALSGKKRKQVETNPILGCFAVVWFAAFLAFIGSGICWIVTAINGG